MNRIFLSIGSNLGDRIEHCQRAIAMLRRQNGIRVIAQSSFYETEPMGKRDQPKFINLVLGLETELEPRRLLETCKAIEQAIGRTPSEHWGPREIDVDILLMADVVIDEPDLIIPHPQMHLRRFVLVPLCELAKDLVHPVLYKTMGELLAALDPTDQMVRVKCS